MMYLNSYAFLKTYFMLILSLMTLNAGAQSGYWQQQTDYDISVEMDVNTDSFKGMEKIRYVNHSPDTLYEIYFHLYYNAFQPGSQMDVHAQKMPDPQFELDWKLKYLTSYEMGIMEVLQVLQNSRQLDFSSAGTLMNATLDQAIPPGGESLITLSFRAQIPLLCRRTGRDSEEGIEYSMAQWYPKLCVYDDHGWHTNPYIGREFYSDFGNYKIQIKIDSSYTVAAGADNFSVQAVADSNMKLWKFECKNVIDFAWAADPDYRHYSLTTEEGTRIHFYYQEDQNEGDRWKQMGEPLSKVFPYISKRFGKYPYGSYHIIQAGDGATEYQQSCFITGNRTPGSLVGVSIHEIMHSWYQQVIASQENQHAWMDEGFASFATTEIKQYMKENDIYFTSLEGFPYAPQYREYARWALSGYEQAMETPANFFLSNTAYDMASYIKGEIFLKQLEYIMGRDDFDRGLKAYFDHWQFRHPDPDDFIRIMEEASGMILDWYQYFWTQSTHFVDYAVNVDSTQEGGIRIRLSKKGIIPMPVDLEVKYLDGSRILFHIPLDLMQGAKSESDIPELITLDAWSWIHDQYEIRLNNPISGILSVTLDPSLRLADLNRNDNIFIPGNGSKDQNE